MYQIIKPFFFLFDPERVHYAAMRMLQFVYRFPGGKSLLKSFYSKTSPILERTVFGIKFPNPVGLAAGFDKDGRWFNELACLGFGFIEIGTVTPLAQSGNEKPRLFRLKRDEAIINRLGFNNAGANAVAKNLRCRKERIIIGGNIGKNKLTPNENALDDYVKCFDELFDVVDYFVVNVSSPNTPGLRALQDKEPLMHILSQLNERNLGKKNPKPILLKIAPDLTNQQLDDIIEIITQTKIAGVIATNTTTSRDGLQTPEHEVEQCGAGGLSGKPLTQRSTEVIRYLAANSNARLAESGGHPVDKSFAIVGVGGISDAHDAQEKLDAGADLVQLYTGFIYEGPGVVRRICEGLARKDKR
ncbi:MAG: quinone-dependent dihydroorotate dehydrogenase [Flavobacteriales bacterium]|nr:quinone-dependent dihydroorotate dehydrogenase [Flavobacteriales bacterium]